MTRARKRQSHEQVAPRTNSDRFFSYARVSTQDQADRDLSIPAQQQAIRDYGRRKGFVIVKEFVDVESAKEPGRTAFTQLMDTLRKDSRITGVICHEVDRLLRNFKDYALVEDYIRSGVDFQFISGNYERSPAGMLGLGVQVLFARHYLDNLAQEVRKGLNQGLRVEHKWAFMPPLGYLMVNGEVIMDPQRFPILQRGWELLASGQYSLAQLADELYRLGLRTRGTARFPQGHKVKKSALSKVFTNPFYHGQMRVKGELLPHIHPPMISLPLYNRCQSLLHGRGTPRTTLKDFTYRGFLFCGKCGCALTADVLPGWK